MRTFLAALVIFIAAMLGGCFSDQPRSPADDNDDVPQTCREAWDAMATQCAAEWDAQEAECEDGLESQACVDRREAYVSCIERAGGDWPCSDDEETWSTCPSWAVIVCDFMPYDDGLCAKVEMTCTDDVPRPVG